MCDKQPCLTVKSQKEMPSNVISAKMLSASANAISAYAVVKLFEKRPDLKKDFGDQAFEYWKEFVGQLVADLCVSVAESKVDLFRSKISWERAAFRSRNVDDSLIGITVSCLADVVKEELPEAEGAEVLGILDDASSDPPEPMVASAETETNDEISKVVRQYLVSILEGDTHGAIKRLVNAYNEGTPLEQLYYTLTQAQSEIGRMWHVAEVSIAEEHLVTHTTHRAMSVLSYHAKRGEPKGLTVVSSAVEGNYHDLGIRAVSDFFEFDGWRVICLGGDTPAREIADAVATFDASLVLLSANMNVHIESARKTVQMVRKAKPGCKILLGGEVFRGFPDLATSVGGDGCAVSINEAVETGNRLCSGN